MIEIFQSKSDGSFIHASSNLDYILEIQLQDDSNYSLKISQRRHDYQAYNPRFSFSKPETAAIYAFDWLADHNNSVN